MRLEFWAPGLAWDHSEHLRASSIAQKGGPELEFYLIRNAYKLSASPSYV